MQNKVPSSTKKGEFVQFRAVLLTKCQREFESDKKAELDLTEREKEIESAPEVSLILYLNGCKHFEGLYVFEQQLIFRKRLSVAFYNFISLAGLFYVYEELGLKSLICSLKNIGMMFSRYLDVRSL